MASSPTVNDVLKALSAAEAVVFVTNEAPFATESTIAAERTHDKTFFVCFLIISPPLFIIESSYIIEMLYVSFELKSHETKAHISVKTHHSLSFIYIKIYKIYSNTIR